MHPLPPSACFCHHVGQKIWSLLSSWQHDTLFIRWRCATFASNSNRRSTTVNSSWTNSWAKHNRNVDLMNLSNLLGQTFYFDPSPCIHVGQNKLIDIKLFGCIFWLLLFLHQTWPGHYKVQGGRAEVNYERRPIKVKNPLLLPVHLCMLSWEEFWGIWIRRELWEETSFYGVSFHFDDAGFRRRAFYCPWMCISERRAALSVSFVNPSFLAAQTILKEQMNNCVTIRLLHDHVGSPFVLLQFRSNRWVECPWNLISQYFTQSRRKRRISWEYLHT